MVNFQKVNLPKNQLAKKANQSFLVIYVWVDFRVSDFVETNYFSIYSASLADYDCTHTSQKEQE